MENYKNSKIGRETAQKYGDILEMERPQTEESLRKHPRMTLQNRAKIFSPFSPLRGYDEQLAAEKQRTERVPKRILTEEEMSALSDRLMQVTKGMTVTVRYFKEDTAHPEVPAVGNYITLTGKADRIDPVFRTLQVGDIVVPFEDLVEVSGEGIMDIDAYLGIRGSPQLPQRALCARRRPHRSHLHLPGVHGRLQPRAHPPHGHAEGDARRHFAVDAQHLLPAQPYAACSPGHYRGPLRCVRERLDEQPCGGGLLRATDTLAERGQRQWSSASRSSHSLTPAARPLTDSLQVLDASWVPYRIVDARAGV